MWVTLRALNKANRPRLTPAHRFFCAGECKPWMTPNDRLPESPSPSSRCESVGHKGTGRTTSGAINRALILSTFSRDSCSWRLFSLQWTQCSFIRAVRSKHQLQELQLRAHPPVRLWLGAVCRWNHATACWRYSTSDLLHIREAEGEEQCPAGCSPEADEMRVRVHVPWRPVS